MVAEEEDMAASCSEWASRWWPDLGPGSQDPVRHLRAAVDRQECSASPRAREPWLREVDILLKVAAGTTAWPFEGLQHERIDVLQLIKWLRKKHEAEILSWAGIHYSPVGERKHHWCFLKGHVFVSSWKKIWETTKLPLDWSSDGFHFWNCSVNYQPKPSLSGLNTEFSEVRCRHSEKSVANDETCFLSPSVPHSTILSKFISSRLQVL